MTTTSKSVLYLGFNPEHMDFTPYPDMNAEKLNKIADEQIAQLTELGYPAQKLWLEKEGDTAIPVLKAKLAEQEFGCIVIGAGIRLTAVVFLEKLINLLHEVAPHTKIALNQGPSDTAESVKRWI